MGIDSYSVAAGANTALFPEGMSPSNVNDGMRTVQSDLRAFYNEPIWIQYGKGDGSYTAAYASASSFTIASADVTSEYHADRRVKIVGTTTGTVYGIITSSSYSDPNTTVNVTLDSGTLQSESLTVYLSAIPATNSAIPGTAGSLGDVVAYDVGTSGGTVPLLNGTNTWANAQTFSGNVTVGGTLGVTGVLTTTTNATVGGNLTVTGSTVSVGGNALTSVATSAYADDTAAAAGSSTTVVMNPATTKAAIADDDLLIGNRTSAASANYTDEVVVKLTGGGLRRLTLAAIDTRFLTPDYDSGAQSLGSGAVVLTHSLGAEPERVEWELRCADAGGDAGHAQGDKVVALAYQTEADSNDGITVVKNATQIKFLFKNIRVLQPDNSGPTLITLAKWTVRVRAWIGGAAP